MRSGWMLVAVALAALVVAGPAAPAADKPAAHGAADKAHAAAGADETPPFLKPALDLTIWTIVVFLVVLFLLSKFAWRPMLEGLERREHAIAEAIEESRQARAEAARLREEIAAERQKAADKIREAMDEARRDAQRLKEEMTAQGKAELQAERDRLYRELATARDQALQEMWNQAAELAAMMSAKAVGRQLSPDDHRALIDEALAEMGPAIAERRRAVRGGPA